MQKLVAVTGATGFIGRRLVNSLVDAGWRIKAITRKKIADTDSVNWLYGDLNSLPVLTDLVRDVSAVIHCAGTVRGGSFGAFAHTNVTGTENLLKAVVQQKQPPRFLFISSLAARQPELSWYARSKKQAEQLVIDHTSELSWTIFRPTAVYGPGDKELKPLFQATRKGLLPVVGKLQNRFGLLHVDDLVSAIQAWLNLDTPCPGIYELDDGTTGGYSFPLLATLTQEIWNRPVRCVVVPHFLIKSIAVINLWLARIFHYSPMLTPGKVKELHHHDWVCDNAPLIHALPHWQPRVRLHDALPLIV
ncbi:MAG: NAD(P)-dependent oxidoreductase [Nitrosomonas sp.]|nr:NAD(P)-dependent oxidoreductase [Nitrosomonas sp.]